MGMNPMGIASLAGFLSYVALGIAVLTVAIHIAFAIAVYGDGDRLEREGRLVFVGAWLWAGATLLGGVFVAGVYWAIHHSTLCAAREDEPKAL